MNIDELATENERLSEENQALRKKIKELSAAMRRAKDILPVMRPSLKRVMQLARDACLSVQRVTGGWMLKMGNLSRRFKHLKEIWELLIADNWVLSEIFTTPEPARVRRILPRPILRRNPSIAPSYGSGDLTFIPSTS